MMRGGITLLMLAAVLAGCGTPADTTSLTTPADSLSIQEGSAEVVKSFLDWYQVQQFTLSQKATTPDAWRAELAANEYLHPDLVTNLLPPSSGKREDPFLLAADAPALLRHVPDAMPRYEEVRGDTDVVAVDLLNHTVLYEVVPHLGKRKIIAVRKPGASAKRKASALDGEWEFIDNNNEYTFSLRLESRGPEIRGWVCALAQGGNRIDCMLEEDGVSLTGPWDGEKAEVNVVSAYSGTAGKAIITLEGPMLHWKLTSPPPEEHFLLREGLLEKLVGKKAEEK